MEFFGVFKSRNRKESKKYQCKVCSYRSKTREEIRNHVMKKHMEICDGCKRYKNKSEIKKVLFTTVGPNQGLFADTPLANLFPTYRSITLRLCADCRLKFLETRKKIASGEIKSERIGRERIDREKGYLYYVGQDGYKWRIPLKTNPSGKKEKVGSEKIEREEGYIYFIDKDGYVAKKTL